MRSPTNDPAEIFRCHLNAARDEGQGIWRFSLVVPCSAQALVDAARDGDPAARTTLLAAEQCIEQINAHRSSAAALLCLLCDNVLWHRAMPAAVGVLIADAADARHAIGHGICVECMSRHSFEQLRQDVLAELRAKLLPGARLIQVQSEPGHG